MKRIPSVSNSENQYSPSQNPAIYSEKLSEYQSAKISNIRLHTHRKRDSVSVFETGLLSRGRKICASVEIESR